MGKTRKTLEGVATPEAAWRDHIVSFSYRGKDYMAPVANNLVLDGMGVGEVKEFLNAIPGKLAYWKEFAVQIEREIADMEEDFDIWFSELYMALDETESKKTESWKKSKIMLDNADGYVLRKNKIRDLQDTNKRVGIIVSSYTTMTWTLREIARLTYSEMSNLELRGRGTLSNLV